MASLPREVYADLKRSGLEPADATRLRLTFLPAKPPSIPYRAYVIPYLTPDGKPNGYERLKLLDPYTPRGAKKPAKYLQKPGTEPHLYLPPLADWRKILNDPTVPIWLTEGEKKAALLTKLGQPCLAVGGVWAWRKREGEDSDPIDDLRIVNWKGRRVNICFDSDLSDRAQVQSALHALREELIRRGANPHLVRLPAGLQTGKTGVDDYLVPQLKKAHSLLVELLAKAEPLFITSSVSSSELLTMKLKPRPFIVPDLLPVGLTILAGPPKIGKSWLLLALGMCATHGKARFLDMYQLKGAINATYLALEDPLQRLQTRIRTLIAAGLPPPNERFLLHTTWLHPDDYGLIALDTYLTQRPDTRLVMIDTLGRMRVSQDPRAQGYQADYLAMTELKRIADEHSCAIVLAHHTKKGETADPMELISGTQGLLGGADTGLVLRRSRLTGEGELAIAGRDIGEHAYAMTFEKGAWSIVGEAKTVRESAAQLRVAEVMREHGPTMGPLAISQHTGTSRVAVFKVLQAMMKLGLVTCDERGQYTLKDAEKTPKKARY